MSTLCTDPKCLHGRVAPAPLRVRRLATLVSNLAVGDQVRVTFGPGHGGDVQVGKLRRTGPSILDGDDTDQRLVLDAFPYRLIRDAHGLPALGVEDIDRWDEDSRFDTLMVFAEEYLTAAAEVESCEPSARGLAVKARDEAKAAFVAEWLRGAS